MRYRELIEGGDDRSTKIANQRKRISSASAALASKEASATASLAAAQKLPLGADRTQRIQAANRKQTDARRSYNDTRTAANDRIRDLMSEETKQSPQIPCPCEAHEDSIK